MPSWKDRLSPPTLPLNLPEPEFSLELSTLVQEQQPQLTTRQASLQELRLALQANELKQIHRFHQLLCEPVLFRGELEPRSTLVHAGLRRILREFHGRVLLSHEPGFDARLEIGLLLAEMLQRGMVQRILFLTSPMFGEQWREELRLWTRRSFVWSSTLPDVPAPLQLLPAEALSQPLPDSFLEAGVDMVVVEGAERLRSRRTPLYRNLLALAPASMVLHSFDPIANKALDLHPLLALLGVPELPPASLLRKELGEDNERITTTTRDVLRPFLQAAVLRNTRNAFSLPSTEIPWKTVESSPASDFLKIRAEFWEWLRSLEPDVWDDEAAKRVLLQTARCLFSSMSAASASLDAWEDVPALETALAQAKRWKQRFQTSCKSDPRWKDAVRFVQNHPKKRILLFCHRPETQALMEAALKKAGEDFVSGTTQREGVKGEDVRLFVASDGDVPVVEEPLDYILSLDLPWYLSLIERRAHWFRLQQGSEPRHFFQMLCPGSPEKQLFDVFDFRLKPSTLSPDALHAILRHFVEESEGREPLQAFVLAEDRDAFFEQFSQQLLETRRRARQIQDLNQRLFLDDYAV